MQRRPDGAESGRGRNENCRRGKLEESERGKAMSISQTPPLKLRSSIKLLRIQFYLIVKRFQPGSARERGRQRGKGIDKAKAKGREARGRKSAVARNGTVRIIK